MSRRSPVNFVGGIYNAISPTLTDQQFTCVQFDDQANLLVNVAAGGTGGNASVSPVTEAVPGSATMIGWEDGSGNVQFVSAANPLPISGTISASNPSVGLTGATAPTSATEIGVIDASGKLQGASATNPVRIDPVGTTIQPVEVSDGTNVVFTSAHPAYVQGVVTLGAGTALIGKVEAWDGSAVLFTSGNPGYVQFDAAQHVIVDSGGGGGTQYTDETAESAGAFIGTVALLYNGTDVVGLRGDSSNNLYVNLHTAIPAGTNLIGAINLTEVGGSALALGSTTSSASVPVVIASDQAAVAVKQGTAANLLCTASQGGAWNVGTEAVGVTNASIATWGTGTSQFTSVAIISNSLAYSTVLVEIAVSGTFTAGVIKFYGALASGDTFLLNSYANLETGAPTISTAGVILTGATNNIFALLNVAGCAYVYAILTTAITGSSTPTAVISAILQSATTAFLPVIPQNVSTSPLFVETVSGSTVIATQSNAANLLCTASGSGVFEVGPTSSANTATNPFYFTPTDGTHAMGTMTAFGSTPSTAYALNANASLFVGTTAVSTSAPMPVSPPNDGTNTATIIAGSTAPTAAAKGLAVQLNPLSQPQVIGYMMDSTGVQRAISQVAFSSASSGAHTLVALSSGLKVYILSWWVSCGGTACSVNLQSHTTTGTTTGVVNMAANGGAVFPPNNGTWITSASGEAIDFNLSASEQVNGGATYCQF